MGVTSQDSAGTKRLSLVPSGGCDVTNSGQVMLIGLVGVLLAYNQVSLYGLGVTQADVTKKIEILAALGVNINPEYGHPAVDTFLMTSRRHKRSYDRRSELDDPVETNAKIRDSTDSKPGPSRPRRRAKNQRNSFRKYLEDSTRTLHNVYDFIDNIEDNAIYHPSILVVPEKLPTNNKENIFNITDNIRWKAERDQSTTTMDQGSTPELEFTKGGLKVTRKGRYFVFAQVTFNGRRKAGNITTPSCSYRVTARAEGSAERLGLMYSTVTPYRLGRMKEYDFSVAKGRYAHDSAHVAGVYILDRGDTVHMEFGPGNRCDVRRDPNKTFFGAYLLSKSV